MKPLDPIDFDTVEFAAFYDELPLWSAPFGLWLLDRVPVRRGQVILDIGAGTGFLSVELAERCGETTTVYAVDPWAAAVNRLRGKLAQRGLSNVTLLQQDAQSLPLPDRSVDLIVSNLGVNNFDQPQAVLAECARVARPGASLLLTTNLVGHMAEFYEEFASVLVRCGQSSRLPQLEAHVGHRATVESVGAMLERAGFAVDDVETGAFRMRFADGAALLGHFFIRLGFLPGWAAIPAEGTTPAVFEALEAALNARAASLGELVLTVPTAGIVARRQG